MTQRAIYRGMIINATMTAADANHFTLDPSSISISPEPSVTCQAAGQSLVVRIDFEVATIVGDILGLDALSLSTSAAMSRMAGPVVEGTP